ncbi:unnamed protein product [Dicrocoelium dendriticum]|nr:unnamed protein product [Dicrocoelium dendriticum]
MNGTQLIERGFQIHSAKMKSDAADGLEEGNTSLNADQILQQIVHPYGLWQWSIALLLMFSCSSLMTFPVYANSASPHRCRMEERVEDYIVRQNFSFEYVASRIGHWGNSSPHWTTHLPGCHRYKAEWDTVDLETIFFSEKKHFQNFTPLENCGLGYVHEDNPRYYPGSASESFETVCDRSWLVPLGTSIYMVGAAVGNIVAGWCAGHFGRRKALIFCSVIEVVSGIWTSLSPNYTSYIIARGVMGAASTGKLNIAGILVLELTVARYRSTFRSLLSFGVSCMYRAMMVVLAYYITEWKWLNLAIMSPNVLSIFYLFVVPESPRWLFSQKQFTYGVRVFRTAYRWNHLNRPKDKWAQFRRLSLVASREEQNCKAITTSNEAKPCSCTTVLHLLRNRQMLKTVILSISMMTGMSMVFSGLLFYARAVRHYVYLVGLLNAVVAFPGVVLFFLLYRLVRHRKNPLMYLIGLTALVLGSSALYVMVWQPTTDLVLMVFSNVALFLMQAALNMSVLYIPELFSSEFRTQGFGLILCFSKLGGITCSFVNILDYRILHGTPLLVYACVMFLALISTAFLPDTSGENLPDN